MTGTLPRAEQRASPSLAALDYVRALSRLHDGPPPPARHDAFAPRLGQWLDWTQAIALSAALAEPALPTRAAAADAAAEAQELALLRAELGERIAATCADLADDAPALRQQLLACQAAMDARIGPLRRRLRARLARGPQARLAQLDAVLEQVLAPRERSLLGAVTQRLAARRDAHFAHELQALLLAELALRLQPVEGLLDACRGSR